MADTSKGSNEEAGSLQPTASTTTPSTSAPTTTTTATANFAVDNDDSDPDFDDLDDVLDQFSANAPTQLSSPPVHQPLPQTTPSASGPGRPSAPASTSTTTGQNEPATPAGPAGPQAGESESAFLDRLSKEMSTMLSTLSVDPSQSTQSPEEIAKMGKELEEFTYRMEKEGIQPEDLLKALLGEEEGTKIANLAQQERENAGAEAQSSQSTSFPSSQTPVTTTTNIGTSRPGTSSSPGPPASPSSASSSKPQPKSFEDTIRSTMSRLGESDKSATTASQQSSTQKNEQDLLAEMLRALDAGPGGSGGNNTGADDGLSKMFLDMMQQLTHKDLLYEPMKELHDQYPNWLEANKSKLPTAEFERYTRQSIIVAEITRKFEEPSFSDDDPKCKEFVWEKMQRMQDEGAPPEDLVKNPFPGTDFGGIPGFGGAGSGGIGPDGGELPEGLGKELEEGCPTQ